GRQVRVDQGEGVGQMGGVELVVVGDDQVNAGVTGNFGRFDARDPAIHGDDQRLLAVGRGTQVGDRLVVEPVSLLDAVRDVAADVGAQGLEHVPQDGAGGNAVDVVVAVDDDRLALADGQGEAVGGADQPGNEARVMQVGEPGLEEGAGGVELRGAAAE